MYLASARSLIGSPPRGSSGAVGDESPAMAQQGGEDDAAIDVPAEPTTPLTRTPLFGPSH